MSVVRLEIVVAIIDNHNPMDELKSPVVLLMMTVGFGDDDYD
jgi:hypothetical protein